MAFAVAVFAAAVSARAAGPVHVGCKIDVETAILAQMAAQLMTADHVPAVADAPLGGTDVLFRALANGDVDVYPEYTGTIAVQILHDPSLTGDAALRSTLGPPAASA